VLHVASDYPKDVYSRDIDSALATTRDWTGEGYIGELSGALVSWSGIGMEVESR